LQNELIQTANQIALLLAACQKGQQICKIAVLQFLTISSKDLYVSLRGGTMAKTCQNNYMLTFLVNNSVRNHGFNQNNSYSGTAVSIEQFLNGDVTSVPSVAITIIHQSV